MACRRSVVVSRGEWSLPLGFMSTLAPCMRRTASQQGGAVVRYSRPLSTQQRPINATQRYFNRSISLTVHLRAHCRRCGVTQYLLNKTGGLTRSSPKRDRGNWSLISHERATAQTPTGQGETDRNGQNGRCQLKSMTL